MEEWTEDGIQTFSQHLYNLCKEGKISQKEASDCADNPRELKLKMRNLPKATKEEFREDLNKWFPENI